MTTREMIEAELRHVPEERLDDLYGIVKQFADQPEGVLARLQAIEAPSDFATNFDLYSSDEHFAQAGFRVLMRD